MGHFLFHQKLAKTLFFPFHQNTSEKEKKEKRHTTRWKKNREINQVGEKSVEERLLDLIFMSLHIREEDNCSLGEPELQQMSIGMPRVANEVSRNGRISKC